MTGKKHMLRNLIRSITGYDWGRFRPSRMDKRRMGTLLQMLTHPIEALNDVKFEGRGSLMLANLICVMMFVVSCAQYNAEAFVFNYNEPSNFNLAVTLLTTCVLMLLWAASNWGVCSLLDGEGTFREIWIMTCYAMLPRALFGLPLVLISRVLTLDEGGIYGICNSLILVWCAALLFLGMMTAHQYTVRKTVASVLLTLAGIAVVFFVAVLLFSMGQQFVSFFETIAAEIRYRL